MVAIASPAICSNGVQRHCSNGNARRFTVVLYKVIVCNGIVMVDIVMVTIATPVMVCKGIAVMVMLGGAEHLKLRTLASV